MVTRDVTFTRSSPTPTCDEAHGSPSRRSSKPHSAATICRIAIARPMVIMTTAKVGLPIMRRRIVRSIDQPTAAMTTAASATEAANGKAVWLNV